MNRPDERDRRIEELEDRFSRLSEASLRVSDSLDFDTVLQEVVDSARALTASRYAAITVLKEGGQTPDFFVSGMTREERQGLWEIPEEGGTLRISQRPWGAPAGFGHRQPPENAEHAQVSALDVGEIPAGGSDPPPEGRGRHDLSGQWEGREGVHAGG